MLPLVLRRLESLQADLATIDPAHTTDAADRVAAMAVALRDALADAATLPCEGRREQRRAAAGA